MCGVAGRDEAGQIPVGIEEALQPVDRIGFRGVSVAVGVVACMARNGLA